MQEAVACLRRWDGINSKWCSWETVFSRPNDNTDEPYHHILSLPKGGEINVHLNALSVVQQNALAKELRNCCHFRQYQIQGSPEPRVHFLLHQEATKNWDEPQPGYQYGKIRLKAIPLCELKEVHFLSDMMESIHKEAKHECEETFWNIGVDCVMYRSGLDRMGYHADNDQGESLVVTVLVSTPNSSTRRVHIRPAKNDSVHDRDVEVMLYLRAGDSYSMDGIMQENYHHGVPLDKKSISNGTEEMERNQRIAIVLRQGILKIQKRDTGAPCNSLQPRLLAPYIFGGSTQLSMISEGMVYTRTYLHKCHAHRAFQKGVSGNMSVGCDAIIVSGRRTVGVGHDNLFELMYAASVKQGAKSLFQSARLNKPVRVMRSSVLDSEYRALLPYSEKKRPSAALYRYDGVYTIYDVKYLDPSNTNVETLLIQGESLTNEIVYLFYLQRSRDASGLSENIVTEANYIQHCIDNRTMSPEAFDSLPIDSTKPLLRHEKRRDFVILPYLEREPTPVTISSRAITDAAVVLDEMLHAAVSYVEGLTQAKRQVSNRGKGRELSLSKQEPSVKRPRLLRSAAPKRRLDEEKSRISSKRLTEKVDLPVQDTSVTTKNVNDVLASLSSEYWDMQGQIGFTQWRGYQLPVPVLIVSPLEAPRLVYDHWLSIYLKKRALGDLKQMCYLVYWYGAARRGSNIYGFVRPCKFISYEVEMAKAKSACKLPGRIQRKVSSEEKLSARDSYVLRGYQEMEEDLLKTPCERKRGVFFSVD